MRKKDRQTDNFWRKEEVRKNNSKKYTSLFLNWTKYRYLFNAFWTILLIDKSDKGKRGKKKNKRFFFLCRVAPFFKKTDENADTWMILAVFDSTTDTLTSTRDKVDFILKKIKSTIWAGWWKYGNPYTCVCTHKILF